MQALHLSLLPPTELLEQDGSLIIDPLTYSQFSVRMRTYSLPPLPSTESSFHHGIVSLLCFLRPLPISHNIFYFMKPRILFHEQADFGNAGHTFNKRAGKINDESY